jgi:hypothetical protein
MEGDDLHPPTTTQRSQGAPPLRVEYKIALRLLRKSCVFLGHSARVIRERGWQKGGGGLRVASYLFIA